MSHAFRSLPATLSVVLMGALALTPAGTAPLEAQTMADPTVPRGWLRVDVSGWFEWAAERFDEDGNRVSLADGLNVPSAAELFPTPVDLRARLAEALADDASDFPLRLGQTAATIRTNEIRVPISLDVGVMDWLTLGVTVPMVKVRPEGTFEVIPDEDADLGVNPGMTNLPLVTGFVTSLEERAAEARSLADSRCASEPGSDGCLSADALADDLGAASLAFPPLFGASVLFPAAGTPTGDALMARVGGLNTRLDEEGLEGLADLPLAAAPLDQEALAAFLTDPGGPYGYLTPPGSIGGVFRLGDIEARMAIRLLEGEQRDSAGTRGLAWSVAATGGVRLPTGYGPEPIVAFMPRSGDGQLDLMGGLYAGVTARRWAVRARASYTLQQAGTITDRIVTPDIPLSSRRNLTRLEWDPGEEMEIEVQPAFRIAPPLSLGLTWRWATRGEDRYERVDPLPAAPSLIYEPAPFLFTDASVMGAGTESSVQELGGSLTFRTTGLDEAGQGGLEVYVEVRRAISGTGRSFPAGTRAVFGGRAFRGLWGGG